MRTLNVGVYPIYPYVSGISASTPFSDEFIRWLFDADAVFSLRRYWKDVSAGELDIHPTISPILLIEGQPYIDRLCQPKRDPSANEAVKILFELDLDPSPYDALVFIILGHVVDGGSTSVSFGGRGRPVCYFDDRGSHSFMAHELGHLLGHDHPFDTALINPTYRFGEYGDPSCIMSAEDYGGFAAIFPIPESSRLFISPTIRFWQSAGPAVSMATLFRYAPDFPAAQNFSMELPAGAAPTRIRINRAGSGGLQLVTMPTTGANSRYMVEYRPAQSWDRGIDPQKAGVVIHQLRNQLGTASDGNGWPKINPVCLAAVISIPFAHDLDWSDDNFAVRVLQSNPGWVDLLVGAGLPADNFVTVNADTETIFDYSNNAESVQVARTKFDCGVHNYTTTRINQRVVITATAVSSGFTAPSFRYELNGVALNSWTATGRNENGNCSVNLQVAVPTTLNAHALQARNIFVTFAANGNAITINLPPGDGAYSVQIKCFVTDNPVPGETGVASGEFIVPVLTAVIQLPAEALADQGACIARMADELRQLPDWSFENNHPEWQVPEINQHWQAGDFARVAERIRRAAQLERRFPAIGRPQFSNLATELGLSTQELRVYADQLERQVNHG